MKFIKKIMVWVITFSYLGIGFGFVTNSYEHLLCNRLVINITDSLKKNFITEEDIISSLEKRKIQYLGVPLFDIDLIAIENSVKYNLIVDDCKAYTAINGTLNIEITQREPEMRIIDEYGKGYYIDYEGNILNLSERFTSHVLIINGHIRSPFNIHKAINIYKLKDGSYENKIREIYTLADFIIKDPLWNAQIQQVYVNKQGEYELVPRVGPHIILLGSIDDYQEKFEKLKLFYKEGLNYKGWNTYVKINLKYKDQVVCTKI